MSYELKLGWGAPIRGCIRVAGLGGTFKEYRLLQSALLKLQSRAHMGIGRIAAYYHVRSLAWLVNGLHTLIHALNPEP